MTLNKTLLAASIAALAFTGSVNAADDTGNANAEGKIHFKGQFIEQTCDIEANDSAKKEGTVQLGTWLKDNFDKQAGKKTDPVPFSIGLKNCPSMLSKARVFFKGTAHPDAPQLYEVKDVTGIGIGISGTENGNYYAPDTEADSIALDADNHSGKRTYFARYQATGGDVNAGTANADVTVTIQYNQ
ncbi:TPA: fimbrial protein [Providencia alcalifaciens]